MKSTLIWGLSMACVLLAGMLIGRHMPSNVAEAQAGGGRPGDYTIIPCEFNGVPTGTIVVVDNVSGHMSVIVTDESKNRMEALPRVNISELFDAAAGRRTPAGGTGPNRR